MEHLFGWVSLFVGVGFPLIGWVFNTVITKKIDDIQEQQEKDRKLFFSRLDADREHAEASYVNQKLYDQAIAFYQKETDSKFNNLVERMDKQFQAIEKKLDDIERKLNGKKTQEQ